MIGGRPAMLMRRSWVDGVGGWPSASFGGLVPSRALPGLTFSCGTGGLANVAHAIREYLAMLNEQLAGGDVREVEVSV